MARKLRLEFPGACYHVINRGNYRSDIFLSARTKAAFETCLFEACIRSAWRLHAFVVMRNHYHLALETPEGNLVAGMQWLQATFANRFNRLRGERGHLFQGRYKALLVEEGEPFAQVAHYIHLNPVRAKIVPVGQLADYRYSSYWYLRHKVQRPDFMRLDLVLAQTGGLVDQAAGWNNYGDYLHWQSLEGPLGKGEASGLMSKGWALGTTGFRATLIQDHALLALTRAWEAEGAREVREKSWEDRCARALVILGRNQADLENAPGRAAWKIALAAHLKERSQASNSWIGRRLRIGCAKYVSRLAMAASKSHPPSAELSLLRGHGET